MLRQLNRAELERLLTRIADDYRLQVPQLMADGSRQLAPYVAGELSLFGPRPQRKPTAWFFPQTDPLLTITANGGVEIPRPAAKPLALFGLDGTDLAGIAFLDRFFAAAPVDDAYFRKRSNALLIGLTGFSGPDRDFVPLVDGCCDIELVAIEDGWLALGYSDVGKELLNDFPAGDVKRLAQVRPLSDGGSHSLDILHQTSLLLRKNLVPDRFWAEIAERCILCSGCNLACPTCSCFCVQDRQFSGATRRSRVWDSCQLDAFMREASGHNPLGTEALRTRRRIHHKLAVDVERWGEIGCVSCGRCDRACPTGIGIQSVAAEIVRRYGKRLGGCPTIEKPATKPSDRPIFPQVFDK